MIDKFIDDVALALLRAALVPVLGSNSDLGSGKGSDSEAASEGLSRQKELLEAVPQIPKEKWSAVMSFLFKQGVGAMVFDILAKLPEQNRPSENIYMQWLAFAAKIQDNYEKHYRAAVDLGATLRSYDMEMMITKGMSLARYYPRPQSRGCGDVDIFCYGKYNDVNELMKAQGRRVNYNSHKHSIFHFHKIMIENHRNFLDIDIHKADIKLNNRLIKLAMKGERVALWDSVPGVYIPVPQFHFLFLARHMMGHMISGATTLRQICDWAIFLTKEHNNIDYDEFCRLYRQQGSLPMIRILTALCVKHLGLSANAAAGVLRDKQGSAASGVLGDKKGNAGAKIEPDFGKSKCLKNPEDVWEHILHPRYSKVRKKMKMPALLLYKTKRFFYQRKLYRDIYNESFFNVLCRRFIQLLQHPGAIFKQR